MATTVGGGDALPNGDDEVKGNGKAAGDVLEDEDLMLQLLDLHESEYRFSGMGGGGARIEAKFEAGGWRRRRRHVHGFCRGKTERRLSRSRG